MMPMPHTRLRTNFSGPAGETAARLQNLSKDHRRPPAALLAVLALTIVSCGSLVGCREGTAVHPGEDYLSQQLPGPEGTLSARPEEGEYLLDYPVQAGGEELTLRLYVGAVSERDPHQRGVRQVAVLRGEELLQLLPASEALSYGRGDATRAPDESGLISVADLNGDGDQDFALLDWTGEDAVSRCWMWDGETGGYRYAFDLTEPRATEDPVTAPWFSGCQIAAEADGAEVRYQYGSGVGLVPLSRSGPEGEQLWLRDQWADPDSWGDAVPRKFLPSLLGEAALGEAFYAMDPGDLFAELSLPGQGRTLGLVRFSDAEGKGLILGTVDHESWAAEDGLVLRDDLLSHTAWTGEDGADYLLLAACGWEGEVMNLTELALYRWDGTALERLDELPDPSAWAEAFPGQPLPDGLLRPDCPFWEGRHATAADGRLNIWSADGEPEARISLS